MMRLLLVLALSGGVHFGPAPIRISHPLSLPVGAPTNGTRAPACCYRAPPAHASADIEVRAFVQQHILVARDGSFVSNGPVVILPSAHGPVIIAAH